MSAEFEAQVKRLMDMNLTYIPFDKGSNQPYITCDEKTYSDQIHVYINAEKAKEYCRKIKDEVSALLAVCTLKNQQLLGFYSNLYTMGINEIVFVEEDKVTEIPLERLVLAPDYSRLPENSRPITNPQLQLTGLYFMQELRRQLPNEEKEALPALEEEMAANLVRGTFLVAVKITKGEEEGEIQNVEVPCVKNSKDDIFQPVFTDSAEFNRFNKNGKYKASVFSFDNLEELMKENIRGFVVNPMGMNLVILKDKIPVLQRRFPGQNNGK